MHWHEKLSKLLEGKNAAQISFAAGLHKSAIRDAIKTKQVPRSDKAFKIARALNVSMDWLFDDAVGWPPPESQDISMLPDSVVVGDALRRKRAARKALDDIINRYHKIAELFKQALKTESDAKRDALLNEPYSALEELLEIGKTYNPMLNAWAGFEGSWEAFEIIVREPPEREREALKALGILEEMEDDERFIHGLFSLLGLWGIPARTVEKFQAAYTERSKLGKRRKPRQA